MPKPVSLSPLTIPGKVLSSPGPGRVLGPDLVSEGRGDGGVTLPGDGQGQEHAGGDGHVTHNIAGREQHPVGKTSMNVIISMNICGFG